MSGFETGPEAGGFDEDLLFEAYSSVLIELRFATKFFTEESAHSFSALDALQSGIYDAGPNGTVKLLAKLREYGTILFPDQDESNAFNRGRLYALIANAEKSGDDHILVAFRPVDQLKIFTHEINGSRTNFRDTGISEMPGHLLQGYLDSNLRGLS